MAENSALSSALIVGNNPMPLQTAPIEFLGDWRESSPEQAAVVIERLRDACLTGIDLLSDRQPDRLRVQSSISGMPHVWLDFQNLTTATVVVDGSGCNWCRLAYQLGHELGHVVCNSWQADALPLKPSQWMEESVAEAFALRGLARLADRWEQQAVLAEYPDYAKHLRRYRELTIARYRSGSGSDTLHRWFGTKRVELENDIGGRITQGPVLLMILAELDRDIECVADLGALNRWPSRAAAPIEDYLRFWQESCVELCTPGRLPRRIKDVLFFDEPAPLVYRRPVQPSWQQPSRGEVCQQVVRIDDIVALDHPVRSVWRFSDSLDLGFLANAPGGPAKPSPALMFSIWLWATAEGIGSARHIARLCEQNLVYRWLCGGVLVDHQMLVEVRTASQRRFDGLLAHSLAVLVQERILTTELMPVAALKNLGLLERSTPQERLKVFAAAASTRVQQLRKELDRDDPVADERRTRAIAYSAVQGQQERVTVALGWMKEIDGDDDGSAPSESRTPRRRDKGHRRRTGH